MARHHSEVGKSTDRTLYLLKRWADAAEYSPLTAVPEDELDDLYYEAEEDEGDQEEDENSVDEWSVPEREERKRRRIELRNRGMANLIEEWFLENFEPPAQGSSYDEYIWGGPFDVREIIATHFPDFTNEDYENDVLLMDSIVEDLERKSISWVPSGSRLEPPTKIDPPKSSEEAFARMQQHVRALKELLQRIPEHPAGIGHNQPPEPLDDAPLDTSDQKELTAAVQIIEIQTAQPPDYGKAARGAAAVIETKMQKVRSWLARQGDIFATEAVKEAGKQFGKWMPRAFWLLLIDRMFSVTETVTHWLELVRSGI